MILLLLLFLLLYSEGSDRVIEEDEYDDTGLYGPAPRLVRTEFSTYAPDTPGGSANKYWQR